MRAVADGRTVSLLQQWTEPDGIQSFSVPRTCSWGQEVLDLDSLDSSRLFSTGDRDYKSLTLSKRKKMNLLSRFSSCAAFAKRRSDSSGIRLNWHSQLRLGLRSVEQSVGQIQKVTLELKSVGQSVGGVTVVGAHRRRLILPSLASRWMTCVSKSALWTPVFLKAPA